MLLYHRILHPLRRAGAATLYILVLAALVLSPASTLAQQPVGLQAGSLVYTDIVGPAGSDGFGAVTVLPNGNLVISDPYYDAGATADVGAVHLYDGDTLALISTLTGSSADDLVGVGGIEHGILVLAGGDYLVTSMDWNDWRGAVTWCSAVTGCQGTVSAANSLVGSTPGDAVGERIDVLNGGGYAVTSPTWDNGALADAGAVTWCGPLGCAGQVSAANSLVTDLANSQAGDGGILVLDNGSYVVRSPRWNDWRGAVTWCSGDTGCQGAISAANSLVGSTAQDRVGEVYALSGGAYAVASGQWDHGAVLNAGAVTRCGPTGCVGVISAANSLVGGSANDAVGLNSVVVLEDGDYVVRTPNWDNGSLAYDGGALTWCDGTLGCVGLVSTANSLVGTSDFDNIGTLVYALAGGGFVTLNPYWSNGAAANAGAATWCSGASACVGAVSPANSLVGTAPGDGNNMQALPLPNGGYLVRTSSWDNGAAAEAGAVTWCGPAGCAGAISPASSLVGSSANDLVGTFMTLLADGDYVVASTPWDNGPLADVGAVTWCSGASGCSGAVSPANSLVGSSASDMVGLPRALPNGAYLVRSPQWDNGPAANAGAVTWCSGDAGCIGQISPANSLVGSSANDRLGTDAVTILTDGSYVVASTYWANAGAARAGAVTLCAGASGCTGEITSANSLVGTTAQDVIGYNVAALANGNYAVSSSYWDNDSVLDAGAVTWCSGTEGCTGAVSPANSLVGTTENDYVGVRMLALPNGDYAVISPSWNNGPSLWLGAVTWASGTGAEPVGAVSSANSVLGTAKYGGASLDVTWNAVRQYLVVSRPADNIVTVVRQGAPQPLGHTLYIPLVLR